jgi:dihydrofolate reductase
MAHITVTEFITLDGVVDDPGGAEGNPSGGWAFQFERGPEGDKFKSDEIFAADAQLLGRRTYEGFAAAWPSREGEFADRFNTMPKYVVSSTLQDPEWNNSHVVSFDDVASLEGNLLLAGSIELVHGLLAAGLVDELRLMVFPVVLGSGRRLFADDAQRTAFELVEAKQAAQVATLVLRRA